MLKRKITKQLIEWKNDKDKMCLMIKGARQVGKTYIIDKFARENYKNYVYINFDEMPSYKSIFDGNLDPDTIIKQITVNIPNVNLIPNETIIFLDEIQNCPNARTALKFLSIDKRFDVVASGSLLGINYKEVPSFPVGYIETIEMYSLDFEEFLWANGMSEDAINIIKEYFDKKEEVPLAMHIKMMELFKEYIVVGGMPKVVSDFVQTHNFVNVLKKQKEIISNYLDDIAKYANGCEKAKARECFLSVPKHLSKDYKKFQYSLVDCNGTAKKYAGSLMWLYDAGIINYCYNLTIPNLPLEGNSINNQFKVYMNDTGLLMAMLEEGSAKDI
ncbi:MAG: AAA family ATPase, partial [Clostridia bacterium]